MLAYGYTRVSTEEQASGGVSLAAQQERIGLFCKLRGMELKHLYCDEGISGGIPVQDRPQGGQLLAQVKAARERVAVVILKLDRLSRNVRDFLMIVDDHFEGKASLFIIDQGSETIDATSATGRMMLTMLASFAELERRLIKDRTRTALAYLKGQGRRVGGIPYGQRLSGEGTRLEADSEEQAVIDLIRSARADGLSIRQITSLLNASAIPSRPRPWTVTLTSGELEPTAQAALAQVQAEQPEGPPRRWVAALNQRGIPPTPPHWNKSSVHKILKLPQEEKP